MKIVVPMLGRGSKFLQAGIKTPKFLIPVRNKYLFEWALLALSDFDLERDGIFIIPKELITEHQIDDKIRAAVGSKAHFEVVDYVPQGAAKTVLIPACHYENQEELIIYNADQFFSFGLKKYLAKQKKGPS